MGLIAIGSLLVLGGFYVVLALVWWILQIIANWCIFTKAGEAGWKSIIPVYGDYVSYRIAWRTSYFWIALILSFATSFIMHLSGPDGGNFFTSSMISLLRLASLVISVMYSVKLSRAFGHGIGFAIGLIFLQPIFLLILGFSGDRYYGADR